MTHPLEPASVASFVCLAVLCALLLKKVALAERFESLRFLLFTLILWAAALYLFSLILLPEYRDDCYGPKVAGVEPDFTCTEW